MARRRRLRWVAVGLVAVVAVAAGLIGFSQWALQRGRPELSWSFSPATNRLEVRMAPGKGMLATWVFDRSHLALHNGVNEANAGGSGQPGGRDGALLSLPTGRTSRVMARVTGPVPTDEIITLQVPSALRIAARGASTRGTLTLVASAPLSHVATSELCGRDRLVQSGPTTLTVSAGVGACRARVTLRARDGERATATVDVPPALRIAARGASAGGTLTLVASAPLSHVATSELCGRDRLVQSGPTTLTVSAGVDACRARVTLRARDGERATATVDVPALPRVPLYDFASPARGAIYITVDDGWTPSPQVLELMRRSHLPVTAFLITDAEEEHLAYWRAFVAAGGRIGDHTVSHPDLTKLSLAGATAQWEGAVRDDRAWWGSAPALGRPPYGAVDPTVRAAAHLAGLHALMGWSATVGHQGIRTWDGQGLEAGEVVLLHWVPGLGQEMEQLLAAIHAAHLHPAPLTPAALAGIQPAISSPGE